MKKILKQLQDLYSGNPIAFLALGVSAVAVILTWRDISSRLRPFLGVETADSSSMTPSSSSMRWVANIRNTGSLPARSVLVSMQAFQEGGQMYENKESKESKVVLPNQLIQKSILFPEEQMSEFLKRQASIQVQVDIGYSDGSWIHLWPYHWLRNRMRSSNPYYYHCRYVLEPNDFNRVATIPVECSAN